MLFKKSLPEDMLILEREGGRKIKRTKNIIVKEKHQSVASHTCLDQGRNPQSWHVP